MKFKYGKYVPSLADEVDMEELVSTLSEMLLSSGFQSPYGDGSLDGDRTMQALHDAILDALLNGGLLPDDLLEQLFGEDAATAKEQLDELVQQLMERMQEAGYITPSPELEQERQRRAQAGGGGEGEAGEARFEVTDKALDFLGFRALRDLLGSVGHATAGRHDTRDMATGVEASGAPKPYEFGDTLNLDASATVLNAVARAHRDAGDAPGDPGALDITYDDLMVAQGEYQSSCATVIMLDCSHSMILYGEDRFTPAKRVAMALSQLIRTQYPGDTLRAVLFHDSAEEIPLRELGRVRVGPYYTNTREGLKLARRLLEKQRQDMRQIIMITDGKPSAITQPDGRVYKNAFGLDPFVIRETFSEVSACAKAGILINTFMLARDYDLVAFVRRVAAMCRGKAYFTTPHTLGQYVLMDYLDKKTRTIH
ncbi:MAG: VWA domain-containing protein [Vicinamibacterales bacterium]